MVNTLQQSKAEDGSSREWSMAPWECWSTWWWRDGHHQIITGPWCGSGGCTLWRARRQARFSLPYKNLRMLPVRCREGGTWSLKRRSCAPTDCLMLVQPPRGPRLAPSSILVCQRPPPLPPLGRSFSWCSDCFPPVVSASANTHSSITSTPAHRLFLRSPMCTFHLILKITCF